VLIYRDFLHFSYRQSRSKRHFSRLTVKSQSNKEITSKNAPGSPPYLFSMYSKSMARRQSGKTA
jgi:hypothetical protein